MRVLHTSDWHLGRSFHREDLLGSLGVFADHLLEVVRSEHVDVVVVSGDIYDRALPAIDAVALGSEIFERLAASRARVVAISGNHDSARRLGAHSGLIDAAGVHFRTVADQCDRPVLLGDEHGEVAFYAIPYLEPETVRELWGLPARSHQAALDHAMARIRADLAPRGARSVVLAHAFAAGATPSDSERDISVGGVNRVGLQTFSGVDYAALGHLHGAQTLSDSVRYSGSPIAYSFSEATHCKGSWLVDLGPGGLSSCEFIEAPVPRALSRLRGTLTDLLTDPAYDDLADHWIEATLTDETRPKGAHDRLTARFPHLLVSRFAHAQPRQRLTRSTAAPGLSPTQMTLEFFHTVRGEACAPDDVDVISTVVESCCREADQVVVG